MNHPHAANANAAFVPSDAYAPGSWEAQVADRAALAAMTNGELRRESGGRRRAQYVALSAIPRRADDERRAAVLAYDRALDEGIKRGLWGENRR